MTVIDARSRFLRFGQRVTLRHPSGLIPGRLIGCYGDLRVTRAVMVETDDGRVLVALRERVQPAREGAGR